MRWLFIFYNVLIFCSIGYAQSLPAKNALVLDFVKAHLGEKVGRGECWDLAAEALAYAGCEMEGIHDFGRKINYPEEALLPGDILQIENLKTKYKRGDTVFTGAMNHHTAIVYEVEHKHKVILAEQNGSKGRITALTPLDFSHIVSGQITYYRPTCD